MTAGVIHTLYESFYYDQTRLFIYVVVTLSLMCCAQVLALLLMKK